VASGAAAELADLRLACADAIGAVYAADPEIIVVVGVGPETRRFAAADFGTFDAFGVRSAYPLGGRDTLAVGARMPPSLAVGAFLLLDAPPVAHRSALSVRPDTPAGECADLGRGLIAGSAPVGLIIMGDGSACRSDKAPGYRHEAAQPFDNAVTKALADADPAALLDLDIELASELLAAGRPAWQVLAGAALASPAAWRGLVSYDAAPYGVQYTVATWTRP
jgi:hypothetical protein